MPPDDDGAPRLLPAHQGPALRLLSGVGPGRRTHGPLLPPLGAGPWRVTERNRLRSLDLDEHLRAGAGTPRATWAWRRDHRHQPGSRSEHRCNPPHGSRRWRDRSRMAGRPHNRSARHWRPRGPAEQFDAVGHLPPLLKHHRRRKTMLARSVRWPAKPVHARSSTASPTHRTVSRTSVPWAPMPTCSASTRPTACTRA